MNQQNSYEEIDIGNIFKKLGDLTKSLIRGLFLILGFFKRFIIVILALVIIGAIYGYYKDRSAKEVYNNKMIIIPNFESIDYLYDKIENLNSKLAVNDSIYLKEIFADNYKNVKDLELEPITDIYNFMSDSYRNIDVLKIIAEKQDINEIMENLSTSKYYKYHHMTVSLEGAKKSQIIIEALFNYLNDNEHFKNYQNAYLISKELEIKENEHLISQIDSILLSNGQRKTASDVLINNTTDLHQLVIQKRDILEELVELEKDKLDYSSPIKVVSAQYNLEIDKLFSIPNIIKYPIYLVLCFSLIFAVIYAFKALKKYSES